MTEPQPNAPEPGRSGGVTQENSAPGQPAVPQQATRPGEDSQAAAAGPGQGGESGTSQPRTGQTASYRGDPAAAAGRAGTQPEGPGLGSLGIRIAGAAWAAALLAAIGMIAVGILLLAWPTATLTVVAILIGAALILAGLLRLYDGATASAQSGGMRAADVVIGLLAIIAGLYCLKHHGLTVVVLALVVGTFWIIHGLGVLITSATSGKVPGRGIRALGGLVSLAAGVVILFWPGLSLVLLLTILGAWLIFYGIALAVLAFGLRRDLKMNARSSRMAHA